MVQGPVGDMSTVLSTTRLSKQEEAKKEMPSVLCPSPAREPGYLVAAGLPFSKQPSVVTSLSAEPDSSLVSTSFQSVPCAQGPQPPCPYGPGCALSALQHGFCVATKQRIVCDF
ncbi:unnamed protein product [Rangifer tarandus platyrhynchus]|uniref:Uncharacterized protein n=2 Tax=Rangifer tarandus platyrhynchus TaxID=3082113 RepID=A0ABN8YCY7_RANTA|nr:unnamed protein product [Rangifer tarandus platyrhynchus]